MSRFPVILLAFIAVNYGSTCLYGDGITVVSSNIQIWGDWTEASTTTDVTSGAFAQASADGAPISVWILTAPNHWGMASATLSSFRFNMEAGALGGGSHVRIYGSATTLFHLDSTQLPIDLTAYSMFNYDEVQDMGRVTLSDATTSTTLLDVAHLDPRLSGPFHRDYLFDVDPDHLYELTLSGHIDATYGKYAQMTSFVRLVPDPAATICLLTLSLAITWSCSVVGSSRQGKVGRILAFVHPAFGR